MAAFREDAKFQNTTTGNIRMILHKGGSYDSKTKTIVGGEIIRDEKRKNIIVNTGAVLAARRLMPGDELTAGLQYLAIGTGYGTGTPQVPEPENPTYTQLRTEIDRVAITSHQYLDGNGDPSVTPTNIIQLTTTFLEDDANGALVEMGLFGGNATSTVNSGYMFNYKVFAEWNKTGTTRLTIVWEITV